jgi:hypothetical protein
MMMLMIMVNESWERAGWSWFLFLAKGERAKTGTGPHARTGLKVSERGHLMRRTLCTRCPSLAKAEIKVGPCDPRNDLKLE